MRGWAPTQRVNNACTLPQAFIAALQNSGQAAAPGAAATAQQVVIEALEAAAGGALPGECVLDPKQLYEVLLDASKLRGETQERVQELDALRVALEPEPAAGPP